MYFTLPATCLFPHLQKQGVKVILACPSTWLWVPVRR